jgi:hypothetical protein
MRTEGVEPSMGQARRFLRPVRLPRFRHVRKGAAQAAPQFTRPDADAAAPAADARDAPAGEPRAARPLPGEGPASAATPRARGAGASRSPFCVGGGARRRPRRAGPLGFEPRLPGLEPGVLPLHYVPSIRPAGLKAGRGGFVFARPVPCPYGAATWAEPAASAVAGQRSLRLSDGRTKAPPAGVEPRTSGRTKGTCLPLTLRRRGGDGRTRTCFRSVQARCSSC